MITVTYKRIFFHFIILFFTSNLNLFSNEAYKINFTDGVKLLLKENASILQNKAALISFEADIEKAKGLQIPSISIFSFLAPTFAVTGDALNVTRDYKKWGVYLSADFTFSFPIFTFFQISLAKQASTKVLEAQKALHKSKINQILFEFKEIYLSIILLKKLKVILDESTIKMNEIIKKAQEIYNQGEGKVLKKDLTKLKVYKYELEKLKATHFAKLQTAQLGLSHYLGMKHIIEIIEDDFPAIHKEIPVLENLLIKSQNLNPQWKALNLGLEAAQKNFKLSKKGLLPIFFIGMQGKTTYSNVRQNQDSSFAYDPYNQLNFGIAAGLQWKFNWGEYKYKTKKAESTLKKIIAQQKEARTGIPFKVSKAYWDLQESQSLVEINYKKLKLSRRWSLTEVSSYYTGFDNTKDLIESVALYYSTRQEVIQSEYNTIIKWMKLAYEVGAYSWLKNWKNR